MTRQAIAPLGWRVSASMDVAAKNLDSNDRCGEASWPTPPLLPCSSSTVLFVKIVFNICIQCLTRPMCRYSYEGLSEDMHTWFFLYDEKVAAKHEAEGQRQVGHIYNTYYV